MRKYLAHEFDQIYVLDLGGNVRKNPKLSGTTHNVFGIQVGVSITLLARSANHDITKTGRIRYHAVPKEWRKEEKYNFLADRKSIAEVPWAEIQPTKNQTWLTEGMGEEFESLMPVTEVFVQQSRGVATSRDAWAYNFDRNRLKHNMSRTVHFYNSEIKRYSREGRPKNLDTFVNNDTTMISWSRDLKEDLKRGREGEFAPTKVRSCLYRPFVISNLFFDRIFNEEVYVFPHFVPNDNSELENRLIGLTGIGSEKPFLALSAHTIVDLHLSGPGCSTQCFPFYTYDEDGTNRRENITDWALAEFRIHYGDSSITKWNIFHYTYALLHHPEYRARYAANLKRELPRIPMAPEFHRYAEIGEKLMKLHIDYEQQPEYPLERTETGQLDWRVEKMRLSKDKTQLHYNEFLTLSGIPPEVYEYRLGNRSALEWVIDQYRVSTDKRSGIVNDPNRPDDPEYIVRLIGQVVTVSLETVRLVCDLAGLSIDQA